MTPVPVPLGFGGAGNQNATLAEGAGAVALAVVLALAVAAAVDTARGRAAVPVGSVVGVASGVLTFSPPRQATRSPPLRPSAARYLCRILDVVMFARCYRHRRTEREDWRPGAIHG